MVCVARLSIAQVTGLKECDPVTGGFRADLLKPLGITSEVLESDFSRRSATQSAIVMPIPLSRHRKLGYTRYNEFCGKASPLLRAVFGAPLRSVNVPRIWELLGSFVRTGIPAARMIARTAPLSGQDFLDEFFVSDRIKGAVASPLLLRTFGGPWTPFGALQLLLHQAAGGHRRNKGAELARRLNAFAVSAGVNCLTERRVVNLETDGLQHVVHLDDGQHFTTQSVVAACSRKLLFDTLIDPAFTASMPPLRARGTCAVMALEVDRLPQSFQCRRILCALGMAEMEQAFDCVKRGIIPDQQVLEISIPRSKGYAACVHAYQTPNTPLDSAAKDRLQQRILTQLVSHIPELAGRITHAHLWTPADLEQEFALPGGHLWHFERDLDQLVRPPAPEFLKGIHWGEANPESGFVCSAGVHAARQALGRRNRK